MTLNTLHLNKDVRMFLAVAMAELGNSGDWAEFYDNEEVTQVTAGMQCVLRQFREMNDSLEDRT